MTLFLKHNLRQAGNELRADHSFKKRLAGNLAAALHASETPGVSWYSSPTFRYAFAIVLAVVVVAAGTTGAYAYTSPTVTAGTPLYTVKLTLEKVEERLQKSPEAKAAFLLKKIDRREAEKKVLETKHTATRVVNQEISQTEVELAQAARTLPTSTLAAPLGKKIIDRLEKRAERLKKQEENRHGNNEKNRKKEDENERSEEYVPAPSASESRDVIEETVSTAASSTTASATSTRRLEERSGKIIENVRKFLERKRK